MGKVRFIYSNLIPSSGAITASEGRARFTTAPQKIGDGSATMEVQHTYALDERRDYQIEIDSVSAGKSVGESTFKWSSDGGATYGATGVTTSQSLVELEDDIFVRFDPATGNDFELGDIWDFRTFVPFHPDGLVDGNRDTEWRSDDVADAVNLVVDLGSAQACDVIAILDHNFSASATVTIQANSSDSWGAAPLSETVTHNAGVMVRYLTTVTRTYRYWRLVVTDTGNTNAFLSMSELFLGLYAELSVDVSYRFRRRDRPTIRRSSGGRGPDYRVLERRQHEFGVEFTALSSSDIDTLQTVYDHVVDLDNRVIRSFFFNFDSASPNDTKLVTWASPFERENVGPANQTVPIEMVEEVRSRG